MKKLILITILLVSFCSYSQFRDYNNTIAVACGGTGSSTAIINKTYRLLSNKDCKKFVKMLYSKNASENFLGVVVCEFLQKKKLIILSEKDLNRISDFYKSDEEVEFCSGCSEFGFEKISKMLLKTDEVKIRDEVETEIDSRVK